MEENDEKIYEDRKDEVDHFTQIKMFSHLEMERQVIASEQITNSVITPFDSYNYTQLVQVSGDETISLIAVQLVNRHIFKEWDDKSGEPQFQRDPLLVNNELNLDPFYPEKKASTCHKNLHELAFKNGENN
jgi:hypothetical protein